MARASSLVIGLSPRVRGNHGLAVGSLYSMRSIPAGAGEPLGLRGRGRSGRVYPRGCGGTMFAAMANGAHYGLSPRVRGNP